MTATRVATHRHGLGWVRTLMVLALTGTACSGTSSTAPPATGPVVVTDACGVPEVGRGRLWVPETVHTVRDLPVRPRQGPGMIRWWRCG